MAALCVSDLYVCVLPSALVLIYHGGRYQDVFHWLLLLFPEDLVNYIGYDIAKSGGIWRLVNDTKILKRRRNHITIIKGI